MNAIILSVIIGIAIVVGLTTAIVTNKNQQTPTPVSSDTQLGSDASIEIPPQETIQLYDSTQTNANVGVETVVPDTVSHTGVFVNGQELTTGEVASLSGYVGTIFPGSYWLDASGNYGVEGNAAPLGNLYGGSNGGGGSTPAGSGDNFWSEGNFGAGNYNADNSQGYVSVPGYGPVDYGF